MAEHRRPWAWIVAVLAAWSFSGIARAADANEQTVPEFDAKFVKMEVPKKLLTDEVFRARITMKNTGTQTWREDRRTHTTLVSQDPERNTTWGTSYFIQGQGTVVEPGKEFTFSSNLKAPSTPGEARFKWRLMGQAGTFFGEATETVTILIEQRPEPPASEAPPASEEPPPPDPAAKRVLTFKDFEYAGSFRVPCGTWTATGLALRTMKDGSRRLFLNEQGIREVEVPALVKFDGTNYAALNLAETKKVWGPLRIEIPKTGDVSAIGPNGGLCWDEDSQTLYWTWYHGYWTGGALPTLAACKLNEDGTIKYLGPWTVPNQKWHWGGITALSKEFADKYTGGKRLALGFGGYYSICGPCSRGPALGAIAQPDPATKTVELVQLLGYGGGTKAPRDGDYLVANCGFWHDQPESSKKGWWTFDDHCASGVFVDLPEAQAYIAFARLGTGRMGYDYGSIGSAGVAQYWYFYGPDDLGAVAKGEKKPGLLPKSMAKVVYPGHNAGCLSAVTGACFDGETRRLYLYKPFAANLSRTESPPLVHVYQVK